MDEFLDKKCLNKCCFIIPIVPGAFIIVLCHVLLVIYKSNHVPLMSTWVFWFYIISGTLYVPFALGFLIGICKENIKCVCCYLIYYGFVMMGLDIIVLSIEAFRMAHGRKLIETKSDLVIYILAAMGDVLFEFYGFIVCYSAYKEVEKDCNRKQELGYI